MDQGDRVTFVDRHGVEHEAEVMHVWTPQCLNVRTIDTGELHTSLMRVDFFPTLPSGHYWKP